MALPLLFARRNERD